ncbi:MULTISPECIES: hypothetical protein [Pseudomonas]
MPDFTGKTLRLPLPQWQGGPQPDLMGLGTVSPSSLAEPGSQPVIE